MTNLHAILITAFFVVLVTNVIINVDRLNKLTDAFETHMVTHHGVTDE
jgi:hypothetical protein